MDGIATPGAVNRRGLSRLYSRLKYHLGRLLQPYCTLCADRYHSALPLCGHCRDALPWLVPGCPWCAAPGPAERICGRCLLRPPAFDRTHAGFRFDAEIASLVRRFKLGGDLAAGRLLSDLCAETMPRWPSETALIPMPLPPSRLRQRGFNQAAEIARRLPGRLHTGLVARTGSATPQRGLGERERRRNVRGAFTVLAQRVPERVVVVDDVMTTGATVNELARVLRRAGVHDITVCALARAERR